MFLIAVPPFIAVPLVNIITELASTKLFVTVSVVSEDPKLTEPAVEFIVWFPTVPAGVIVLLLADSLFAVTPPVISSPVDVNLAISVLFEPYSNINVDK